MIFKTYNRYFISLIKVILLFCINVVINERLATRLGKCLKKCVLYVSERLKEKTNTKKSLEIGKMHLKVQRNAK